MHLEPVPISEEEKALRFEFHVRGCRVCTEVCPFERIAFPAGSDVCRMDYSDCDVGFPCEQRQVLREDVGFSVYQQMTGKAVQDCQQGDETSVDGERPEGEAVDVSL